ncbi:hypothetical protein IEQ34_024627 [Dendrobium chrysotoxum]|uniref:Uncharacterized protein n=1 Tax=Dendrobium chrysotoxum TaxID=161865 RepID=A0AAV7FT47_DENCH|nr:hypothetical protein IEQ34_024627 [Dendrobium chrysotoxum]
MSPKNEFISAKRLVQDQARSEEDLVYFIQKNGKSGKEASASQFGKHREKRCVAKKEDKSAKTPKSAMSSVRRTRATSKRTAAETASAFLKKRKFEGKPT